MQLFKQDINCMIDLDRRNASAWDYYEGGVPEFFASPALRKIVRGTVSRLGLNYSRVVVSEMLHRLEINAVLAGTNEQRKIIKRVMDTNEVDLFFDKLFETASVYGQALAMAWPDEEGNWRLSSHTPRNFYVKYSLENPWEIEYVLRIWQHDEQTMRMNVFYADKIVKYTSKSMGLSDAANWEHLDTIENPFGQIPCVHLRNDGDYGRPEHYDAYSAQDAINKLVTTHLYVIDFQGAPQRYVLAHADQESGLVNDIGEEGDAFRSQIESLDSDSGTVWALKGIDQVGEFSACNPEVFWNPIKDYVRSMASLTGTPLHYFESTGNVPSGQALRAAEAPLITKVKKRRNSYGVPLKRLFEFILRAENQAKPQVDIKWADLESMDEMEKWDLILKQRNAGIPLRQILLESKYTEAEITKIFEWKAFEKATFNDSYVRNDANGTTTQRKPEVRVQPNNDETNIERKVSD